VSIESYLVSQCLLKPQRVLRYRPVDLL